MGLDESGWSEVFAQKERVPRVFGNFDFGITPERFTTDPDVPSAFPSRSKEKRARILADEALVDLIRAYTMMGDPPADAYAALMGQYPFRKLIDMLVTACDQGIEAVPDAPQELVTFVAHMERKPDWLDMAMVEEGAAVARNYAANALPLALRSGFLWTFLNKYAARPMLLTGNLSNATAGRRAKETLNFMAVTTLPGALGRYGRGFKAAAMVRLMHSMVRVNLLRRPEHWDARIYGFPVPQVDQMPAGMALMQLLAKKVLAKGRTQFTRAERAEVEFSRYRCYLLGLPEKLLPTEPRAIIEILSARAATLRAGFDDENEGALVRATMAADIWQGDRISEKLFQKLERGFAGVYLVKYFLGGDEQQARRIGVVISRKDKLLSLLGMVHIGLQTGAFALARMIPYLRARADNVLVARIEKVLSSLGHAHFESDAEQYRPTPTGG